MSDLLLYGCILYCGGQFAVFIVKIIHGYQSDSEHTATSNVGSAWDDFSPPADIQQLLGDTFYGLAR